MRKVPGAFRSFFLTVVVGGFAVGACLAALLPGVAAVGTAHHYTSDKLGTLRDLKQRSTIYDAAGGVIAVLGEQNREDAKLDEVPQIIQDAVIAVEDQTFWENEGVDLNATVRAFLKNLTSGEIEQGGSTVSQQLVKNRILTSKRDINRKVREIILATRLNEKYSKREILEQYLNTVYFGQGSYGIKTAVERFFLTVDPGAPLPRPKTMAEVTVAEAALLAGVISNPEGNNPFTNPEGAATRRNTALRRMVEQDVITEEQAAAAAQEPLPTIPPPAELRPATSWGEEVQDRLINDEIYKVLGDTPDQREEELLTGGLKVYATKDPRIQQAAEEAMAEGLPNKPGWTGSLVSIEPKTGFVKAMVAGPGFEDSQYNIATSYPGRQAGSTWKVITLAAALESGFSPNDQVDGASPCAFGALGRTQNAGEGSAGRNTLRHHTANSTNCAYARIELAVGFDKVIDTAYKLGITQQNLQPILSMTLGTIESTATEMATVAATISNGGLHHPPIFVSKITGPDGEVLFDATRDVIPTRVMSETNAYCEIDITKGTITGGTGTNGRLNGRVSAGKTGTTDNRADANFLQMTPQLVAFTWHGFATERLPGAGFGGQIPAGISKLFLNKALEGQPAEDWPAPGEACARKGAFITESGRTGTAPGVIPGDTVPTLEPPTVVVNPPTTTPVNPCSVNPDLPPCTKPGPSTSAPTSAPTTLPVPDP
jgi:penicillin-binding protein 1A